MRPFERIATGEVSVSFTVPESELLNDLSRQVSGMLESVLGDEPLAAFGIGGGAGLSSDPAVARLLPDAYRDDADSSDEFRRLTEHALVTRKIANLTVLSQTTAQVGELLLNAEEQQAWLRALTDVRLVIASRLGIETDDHEPRPQTDEQFMLYDVYDWLGSVQGSLIDALDF